MEANGPEFKVNGKPIRILSGSLHYFRFSIGFKPYNIEHLTHRVHPEYWQTRLRQYKVPLLANFPNQPFPIQAAGLNVVDVYVPWNLHEPRRGDFDFGEGSSQFSPFLNITRFLQLVKEEDLLAILRSSSHQTLVLALYCGV